MFRPKEFTDQEQIIALCLDGLGMRYEQQQAFGKYTVDFFIPDLSLVIEADGIYGHLKKADSERDAELIAFPEVERIFHINAQKKENIEKILLEFMVCLELSEYLINTQI